MNENESVMAANATPAPQTLPKVTFKISASAIKKNAPPPPPPAAATPAAPSSTMVRVASSLKVKLSTVKSSNSLDGKALASTTASGTDAHGNELFCHCLQPDDGTKPFIACDRCGDWYHFDCVDLKGLNTVKIDYWLCGACEAIADEKETRQAEFALAKAKAAFDAQQATVKIVPPTVPVAAAPPQAADAADVSGGSRAKRRRLASRRSLTEASSEEEGEDNDLKNGQNGNDEGSIESTASLLETPMSFEEKRNVRTAIYNLPSEYLLKLLKRLRKKCKQSIRLHQGGEITIDFELLDNVTLRQLEAQLGLGQSKKDYFY